VAARGSSATISRGRGAIRIAILDDHQLVLDGLAARLYREPGIEVVSTHSTWSGLLADSALPVDVVVLDLNLADGIPVSTKVHALGTMGSSVVVISKHAGSASINSALQAGALAFIAKTDSADDLIASIRSAAAREPYLSGAVAATVAKSASIADPGLGRQEQRALVLYAGGQSVREVAEAMATTDETVKSYIKRARRKYRDVGVDVGTRSLLRRHAIQQGWMTSE
jgi:DNA-binding NarL/FixJ family response regulator